MDAKPAGKVVTMQGEAFAQSASAMRVLQTDDPVFQKDVLLTEKGSNLEVLFEDGTRLAQGAESKISVETYTFDPAKASASAIQMNMSKGVFRVMTGKIAEQNPDNFKVKSPLVEMGIRGTITISDVKPGAERHGVLHITPPKMLVIKHNFTGEVRFIDTYPVMIEFYAEEMGDKFQPDLDLINYYMKNAPFADEPDTESGDQLSDNMVMNNMAAGLSDNDFSTSGNSSRGFDWHGLYSSAEQDSFFNDGNMPESLNSDFDNPYDLGTPDLFPVPDDSSGGKDTGNDDALPAGQTPETDSLQNLEPLPIAETIPQLTDTPIDAPIAAPPNAPIAGTSDVPPEIPTPEQTGEHIIGTEDDDELNGTAYNDTIEGLAGDDTLNGGAGDDSLLGGDDNDTLQGNDGNDTLDGGGGVNTASFADAPGQVIVNLADNDQVDNDGYGNIENNLINIQNVIGSEHNDSISGDDHDNHLSGLAGDDYLFGAGGDDTLQGGAGKDTFDGGGGVNTVTFENAPGPVNVNLDSVIADDGYGNEEEFSNINNVVGSAHDDAITGNEQSNLMQGAAGADVLKGEDGADTIFGEAGDDNIQGGAGDDNIMGDDGDDALTGDDGDDAIWGDNGDDSMYGGAGDDALTGGDGDDNISGDDGKDIIRGSVGDDVMYGGGGDDNITGGDGDDSISGDDGKDLIYGSAGEDVMYGGGGDDLLDGGADNDLFHGDDGDDVLWGGAGDDTFYGDAGDDNIIGQDGDDKLFGGAGNDTMLGQAGNDTFGFDTFGSADADVIDFNNSTQADQIHLQGSQFNALPQGTPLAEHYNHGNNPSATNATQHILYNSITGNLYYDADGNGAGFTQTTFANINDPSGVDPSGLFGDIYIM
ncbi:FecR domain-containing protein [Desulfococcaceae bacterium HSG7]|nr:FecR domain-containing protein [Desulfococcaceae bacterium HSG7]